MSVAQPQMAPVPSSRTAAFASAFSSPALAGFLAERHALHRRDHEGQRLVNAAGK